MHDRRFPPVRCAVWLGLMLCVLAGCGSAEPPVLRDFKLESASGPLSHELVFTNETYQSLRSGELTVSVYTTNQVQQQTRHVGLWPHGGRQTVKVPADGGAVEWIDLTGTAQMGADRTPVAIEARWIVHPAPAD